jgi:acetyltransferase-like isoleucine patch superfamily enzyme
MISRPWSFFALHQNVKVGKQSHLGLGLNGWVSTSLTIGNQVCGGPNCSSEVNGRICNGVLISNNLGNVGRRDHETHIEIDVDVWEGFGAITLGSCIIETGALIGSSAVFSSFLEENPVLSEPTASILRNRFSHEDWSIQKDFYV